MKHIFLKDATGSVSITVNKTECTFYDIPSRLDYEGGVEYEHLIHRGTEVNGSDVSYPPYGFYG